MTRAALSSDFRAFLKSEYEFRQRRNSSYSLRAFAKALGTEHSTLSQLMRGKRAITDKTVARLGRRLGLTDETLAQFIRPTLSIKNRGKAGNAQEGRSTKLSLDTYHLIAEWYHYALLELTRVASFRPSTPWIAKALGISREKVNAAISRLLRLGFLEMTEHDRWQNRSGDIVIDFVNLNELALKNLQREVHQLAMNAVDAVPAAKRAQIAGIIACSSRQVPHIQEAMERFKVELCRMIDVCEPKDDVFQLDLSFFPLTTFHKEH